MDFEKPDFVVLRKSIGRACKEASIKTVKELCQGVGV
jgi:hypothetical protein